MPDNSERRDRSPGRPSPQRQPGWVLLTGVFAVACLMIGLILLAMLQAPVVRPKVITTAVAFIAAGVLLLPVAWMKRVRRTRPLIDLSPAREVPPPTAKLRGIDMAHMELTPENKEKLETLSRLTGKTHEQLLNDALDQLKESGSGDEAADLELWRGAMLKAEGMWRDRQDLPDFDDIRRSTDRELWSESAT